MVFERMGKYLINISEEREGIKCFHGKNGIKE